MKLDDHIRKYISGEPTPVDLGDGDSITIYLADAGNDFYLRGAELEFEALKELGEPLEPETAEPPEGETPAPRRRPRLSAATQNRINTEALIGTILTGWDDEGLIVGGQPFTCRHPDGTLHAARALQLLKIPAVSLAVRNHLTKATAATNAETTRGKGQRRRKSGGR